MMAQASRLILAVCCVGLAAVIAGEQLLSVPAVEASTAYAEPPVPATAAPATAIDVDALVTTITEKPLFTASRRPPAPPVEPPPPPPTAPELKARLAGMVVGPDDREALFAREGGGVVAVRERQEIDGWTVTAIEVDKVVVTSSFGERVLQPTPGNGPANLRPGARSGPPMRRLNPAQAAGTAPAGVGRPNIPQPPALPGRQPPGANRGAGNNPRS